MPHSRKTSNGMKLWVPRDRAELLPPAGWRKKWENSWIKAKSFGGDPQRRGALLAQSLQCRTAWLREECRISAICPHQLGPQEGLQSPWKPQVPGVVVMWV